jgi:Tfp pilus assembly protein PilX
MTVMRAHSCRRQRGVAALFVTVLLCFAMILLVAYAHRNAVVEEQRSANDYRAAEAFEAAEAGLEWALARVNDATPLAADCQPSADPSALSLRDRMLRLTAPSGDIVPATWSDAGTARPLQAACLRNAAGWTCSCPTSGSPLLAAPSGTATAPAFAIEFAASPRPGVVRIVATGCTRRDASGVCAPTTAIGHEAAARLEAAWALLPALRSAPVAALTVRGNVDAGAAALGVHNIDPGSAGLALHAGGRVTGAALRITAPSGSALGGAIVAGDASLSASTGEQFFARYFGMDRRAWSAQPAVQRIACASDCTAAITAAIAAGKRLLFIDGDLALIGPAALGSAAEPIAIVAAGALRFSGDVAINGIVHGISLAWNDASAADAFVRGAALVGGDYAGNAAADFSHDDAVLTRLKTGAGSFVRVNGSWKDF